MGFDDVRGALRAGAVPVCHQPVFIIGSPRSGTTALARALAEHSGLWTSHESYFLHGLFGDGRPARVHHKQVNRDAFGWVITEEVDRAEFLAYVGVGLNALFTSRAGGRRWIDQTPMYTLIADDLAELFPDALFLHILRDGRGVVNSMMSFTQKFAERPEAARHVPGWATDLAEACCTWASYVTSADEFCLSHPARTLTVVNDTLSADPVRGFDEVLTFLGLAAEPGPAEHFGGKRINSSFVRGSGRPDTWDSWPVDHREVFVAEAGAAMVEVGLADAAELQRWAEGAATPDLRTREDGGRVTAPLAVVAGAISSKLHNGGEAWVRMSWLRAARAAGCEAWLFEQIADPTPEQIRYFQDVAAWFDVTGRAVLADASGQAVVAPEGIDPRDVADAADVLLNISGHLHGPTLFERFARRVLIDIDPGFTQMWHAQGLTGAMVDGHDALATIGENIGDAECTIPTSGLPWIPTRQPTCVDDWTTGGPPAANRFTTVASWRGSYGPVEHDGRRYGVEAHEFRKILDLPARCPTAQLEIALDIHAGDHTDRTALMDHGWALADPAGASATPDRFRRYVHSSSAELSVAQGMYVDTRSGWFSDRTARYLASGRPVVVQDTGFTRNLPAGAGLLAFRDAVGAADAVADVLDDYPRHAAAARHVAEEHFGPERVIGDLLGRVL